ncbi:N-acetyl-gamma-glutamyl-phosphate reductase [Nonomuraea sp. NPDC052116]|uniref:N-acetyl-gamma-glutamyl-phosphate reductase n=1 Tax=Nonomuraea sp. NPDC052116 TaxID=3155665 RepID=UPI0034239443
MLSVAVVGGSGYIGGELLRLLLCHPKVRVAAVTSDRLAGRRVDGVHPNLRGLTDLCFSPLDALEACDVAFVARPHTQTMELMPRLLEIGKQVIDLSGDFRLRDPAVYERYYGVPHADPGLIPTFAMGLPELNRERLTTADRVSVPGCMAVAAILALHPLTEAGLVTGDLTVDARTGSSGAGAAAGEVNLHAERSGVLRVFAPLHHRHEAEISQATGRDVRMTATGVEAVRGVQVLCRATLTGGAGERDVRRAYRERYRDEPFVRVVAHRRGPYRLPEHKILSGSNLCDVGFAVDEESRTVLAVAALDNLMKGGAGSAVQCLNVRLGWPERLGLEFPGLHPI